MSACFGPFSGRTVMEKHRGTISVLCLRMDAQPCLKQPVRPGCRSGGRAWDEEGRFLPLKDLFRCSQRNPRAVSRTHSHTETQYILLFFMAIECTQYVFDLRWSMFQQDRVNLLPEKKICISNSRCSIMSHGQQVFLL